MGVSVKKEAVNSEGGRRLAVLGRSRGCKRDVRRKRNKPALSWGYKLS